MLTNTSLYAHLHKMYLFTRFIKYHNHLIIKKNKKIYLDLLYFVIILNFNKNICYFILMNYFYCIKILYSLLNCLMLNYSHHLLNTKYSVIQIIKNILF